MEREAILQQASEVIQAYLESYRQLPEGSQKDALYKSNFLEGLTCRCISDICKNHGIKANSRLSHSDYITDAAKKQLEQNNKKGLVKEHMVPKNVYFNNIVDESKKGTLTKE